MYAAGYKKTPMASKGAEEKKVVPGTLKSKVGIFRGKENPCVSIEKMPVELGLHSRMPGLNGRFYKKQWPVVDEVVMVKVLAIFEYGAYVMLLEYNGIKGMIYLKELSSKRIRSIKRILRLYRKVCLKVIKVNQDTGYIYLSKRCVTPEQVKKCEDKYKKAKTIFWILHRVATVLDYTEDEQLESLCRRTAWVFDDKYNRPGYGAYAAFQHAVFDPSILDGLTLKKVERSLLIRTIKRRLVPPVVKIQADVEVACYRYEGIDAVKYALRAGLNCSTENMPIKINLIASPCYAISTTTQRREEGLSALNRAIQVIKEKIEEKRGIFNVQMEPTVITNTEELQLAQLLKRL